MVSYVLFSINIFTEIVKNSLVDSTNNLVKNIEK